MGDSPMLLMVCRPLRGLGLIFINVNLGLAPQALCLRLLSQANNLLYRAYSTVKK